ncbi:MAG TPA: FkbM family methyltransferase [Edaphocola sp.]|nr:FkbM family methyltransferase [Edaphocola sp.]
MIREIVKNILKTLEIPLTQNLEIDINTERIIRKLAKEGKIRNGVDIGVLDGDILRLFIKYMPSGKHSGIEPISEKFEKLKAVYGNDSNIYLYNYAAGEENEKTKFFWVTSNPSYSGLRKRDYPKEERISEIEVEKRRLDDILDRKRKVDIIKIDVEGGEYGVLLGAEKILKQDKPILIFEFGLGAANHYSTSAKQMYELLTQFDYKIYTLKSWLKGQNYFDLQTFEENYKTNKHYYFIAE